MAENSEIRDAAAALDNSEISDNNTTVKSSTLGKNIKIGDDCLVMRSSIGDHCEIDHRNLIVFSEIGEMTYTGADTSIMWSKVGKFCCISRLVDIGGNEHHYQAASMMPPYRIKSKLGKGLVVHHNEAPIVIGNDVWIGAGACILRKDGLTIGDGAVIGSGAVVTKSIPPYAIAAGVPAKVIKYRFPPEMIDKLLELRWWDWDDEMIYENRKLLTSDLTMDILDELCAKGK